MNLCFENLQKRIQNTDLRMPQSENRDDVPTAWTADSCNRIRVRMRHLIADHYQMRRVFQYVIHRCMRFERASSGSLRLWNHRSDNDIGAVDGSERSPRI